MAKKLAGSPESGFSPELETQIFLPGSRGLEINSGANILRLERNVDYPNRGQVAGTYLAKLLLEELEPADTINGARTLILPNNFITFAQVFNDALSARTSGDNGQKQLARDNLFRIGAKLGNVVDEDKVTPVSLTYKNILFSRDTDEVKLLPPLQFEPARSPEAAKDKLIDDFLSSCLKGATAGAQLEQFMEVSHGFTDGIEAKE